MTEPTSGKPRVPETIRRRGVAFSGAELVKVRHLDDGRGLPMVVEPALEGVNLAAWAASHKELIEDYLARSGGILFTGFGLDSAEALQALIQAVSGKLLEYTYRSTPRSQVSGDIYTSTEYPPHQTIPLHNEMSYSRSWPLKIWFLCLKAAERGGETPIADSGRVFQRIDPAIRERFAAKGVMYIRNYGEGVDLAWEDVFQTRDSAAVEEFCHAQGIGFEWKAGNRLRTWQVCQAVAEHPKSGEKVWFNQAHLFHPSGLGPAVRESMVATFGEEGLPRNACYGDGSAIEDSVFDAIRAAYDEESVAFPWRSGDVLLLDNMRVAHGRRPFEGPRKVVVGMAEPSGTDMGS
jgi:alpha-ketoglutarate-dependent taurine dioxygenase